MMAQQHHRHPWWWCCQTTATTITHGGGAAKLPLPPSPMVVVLLSHHHHRHHGSDDEGPPPRNRAPINGCVDAPVYGRVPTAKEEGPHVHRERIYNCVAGAETHRKHAPCMTAVRGSLILGCAKPFTRMTAYAILPHRSTTANTCTSHIWRVPSACVLDV